MSVFFNMLSRLVITFLPRSKRLLISSHQLIRDSESTATLSQPVFNHLNTNHPSLTLLKTTYLIFSGHVIWKGLRHPNDFEAFEMWCWRRLLRVPWTARRSNQSILKEISPGISLEGLMLKLKLQYFRHLMRRVDSLEKTLMLGGIGGRRRRG